MRRLNAIVVGALTLVMIGVLPAWRPIDAGSRTPAGLLTDAPSGITSALREIVRPGDRILNPQAWGSWFEYALPGVTVAVDSRIELYPPEVWRAYEAAISGPTGSADDWALDYLVVDDPVESAIDGYLASGWRVRVRTPTASSWARD